MNSRCRTYPFILLSLLVLSCGSPTGNQPHTPAPISADTTTRVAPSVADTTAASSAIGTTDAPIDTLPDNTPGGFRVVLLRMDDVQREDAGDTTKVTYPAVVKVTGAEKWHGRIAAYGTSYNTWLAPSRWTGSGMIAGNSGDEVTIYPPGGSDLKGCYVQFHLESACAGCVYGEAAPYFPRARDPDETYTLPEGIKLKKLSRKMIVYSLPEKNGISTKGIVFFGKNKEDGDIDDYFMKVELALPANQPDMMDFLLKYYIKWMENPSPAVDY